MYNRACQNPVKIIEEKKLSIPKILIDDDGNIISDDNIQICNPITDDNKCQDATDIIDGSNLMTCSEDDPNVAVFLDNSCDDNNQTNCS